MYIVIGVVVGVVVLVALIIANICCYKKKKLCYKKRIDDSA